MTAGQRVRLGPAWTLLQAVLSASLLVLFVLPIVAILTYAPVGRILTDAGSGAVRASISVTLFASGLALAFALLFGIPLGYLLARRRFPGRALVESVVALPVVIPHLMVGIGLFFLFVPANAPLHGIAAALGLPVYDTIWGVVLVMVFVSAPYTVLAAQLAFEAIDERLLEAARSLGAGGATTFLTVTLPLAFRGIVAGAILSWARAVSEIGGLLILAYAIYPGGPYGGPVTSTISVAVYELFQLSDLQDAAAVSSVFLLIAFALFLTVRIWERTGWLPWRRGDLTP